MSRQELVGTYLVDIAAMFFGMPLALFPAIAERLGGASVLGLLYAAPAAGALLLSLSSGWNSGGPPPWPCPGLGGHRVGPGDHRLWLCHLRPSRPGLPRALRGG